MSQLESRKQLLIAESEINRVQLVCDVVSLAAGVRAFTARAKTFGTIASSVAALVAGLTSFVRGKSPPAEKKPSWWQALVKGAKLAGSLWT